MAKRPKSWANWRAYLDGKRARHFQEFELYSDSDIHGTSSDFGPYTLVNLLADEHRDASRPVVALRLGYVIDANLQPEDAEHGGRHPDEIAALVSLALGIRLYAGGATRRFDSQDKDVPFGVPQAQADVETPVLLPGAWTRVVPQARRRSDLDDLVILDSYPLLDEARATALMRSARLYQEAIWISEREPSLTWLLLVSAVETAAAAHNRDSEMTAEQLLRELDPKLAQAAAKYGDECVKDIATTQIRMLGATKKFFGFLEAFMPEAPDVRPREYRLDWTVDGLRVPLKQIYGLRSAYLHSGDPFPWQLRMAPEPFDGIPTEQPPDHVAEARQHDGSKIANPDLPMNLHAFEHIVRGALVRWWKSLTAETPVT